MRKIHKYAAFTLAEVLITLGVIGIVAAMTIPVMINKINHIVLKNQFKEMYSTLSTALLKTSYDMNFNTDCYYIHTPESFKVVNNGCEAFYKEYFTKNLKIIKTCDGNGFNDGCLPDYDWIFPESFKCPGFDANTVKSDSFVAVLNNGSLFFSYGKLPNAPIIGFDVNGRKAPNKIGEDIFATDMVKIGNGTVRLGKSASDGRIMITACFPNTLYLDDMMK